MITTYEKNKSLMQEILSLRNVKFYSRVLEDLIIHLLLLSATYVPANGCFLNVF